ncbi:MAG: carboxylating nicotinate-nucleotide diphosphorylase [Myxococcales bacterium]|nr:carboxylating nicotinate-nucleotide diphosphorylase [Myxococcales bacterium]
MTNTPQPHLPPRHVLERIVQLALEEDLGRGDLTTEATVPRDVRGAATFTAREPLVFSGFAVIEEVFRQVDPGVTLSALRADGEALQKGDDACRVEGSAASILRGERVALNFVQRMSGVATQARGYVDALPAGSRTRIADTRKTTPGLRALERYAVRCGGAYNHREDLSSAVLIKDNHIAAAGGVAAAIGRARAYAPHTTRIECEVDTMAQLRIALEAGADIIMLDNFDDEQVREAIGVVAGRCLLEASGGITLGRVRTLGELGIDVISVGALTHSAPAVDLGLDWVSA